jgi:predicted ATPase
MRELVGWAPPTGVRLSHRFSAFSHQVANGRLYNGGRRGTGQAIPWFFEQGESVFKSITFTNFKALRDTTLPLAPFTLLLGPNGSGKSTVLSALETIANRNGLDTRKVASVGASLGGEQPVRVRLDWVEGPVLCSIASWDLSNALNLQHFPVSGGSLPHPEITRAEDQLRSIRVYSLDSGSIALPTHIGPDVLLARNGTNLAGVLDQLRDDHEERFVALNAEMRRWLPEYDKIEFDRPAQGQKGVVLLTKKGEHRIPAAHLSQGTLLALALLTLAYQPNPPLLIGLEEPDRGLHPRILRELRDALYRLSYPESAGEARRPVQVIVTTHSPYLLDLYRDHPEEVVLAQKDGLDVHFQRLADKPDIEEILGDAPLSEAWYSGILGGVPSSP